ncbi:potassium channel family protein [candidate division KSB1 bacterium]
MKLSDFKTEISLYKTIRGPIVLIVGTIVFGVLGYEIIEGWDFLESLYQTVITLSTVGFGEIKKISDAGRVFTIILVGFGIGSFGYTIGSITSFIVEGELKQTFRRKKMMKKINSLADHFILCGYGRTGKQVANEFLKEKQDFVVIDTDEKELSVYEDQFPVIIGNATEDETLIKAGIERARGLVACLKDDADNIFVTLSARQLNHKITIVTRCMQEETENKLYRAGANKVILPLVQVGKRIARMMINPDITSFMDVVSGDTELDLLIDELKILQDCELEGKTLLNSGIREKTNGMVFAIKKSYDKLIVNPSIHEEIINGDTLIVICEVGKVDILRAMAGHKR